MLEDVLLTEKYRPKAMADMILPKRVMKKFENGISNNLLFHGTAGLGKTSLAYVLVDQFKYDSLYINASNETSVDVVREKITNYASKVSVLSAEGGRKLKVVILDEVDGASNQFFKALRATIEKYAKTTRFIMTCNYINQIPEPMQSRFEVIDFNFRSDEEKEMLINYQRRLEKIAKEESIDIDRKALAYLNKKKFPDMRAMLTSLQGLATSGLETISMDDVKKTGALVAFRDLYELILNPTGNSKMSVEEHNYKYVMENYSQKIDDALAGLGTEFVEYIMEKYNSKVKAIPEILHIVVDHQTYRNQVLDPLANLLSAVYKCQQALQKV